MGRHLELRHLRYFLAVTEELVIAAAAGAADSKKASTPRASERESPIPAESVTTGIATNKR